MITSSRIFELDFESSGPFESAFYNEKLWMYYKTIWNDPAEYKVLIARRMLNLNEALLKKWNANNKEQYFNDGIMSNIAFLLSAKDIADRYARKNTFPRILICDDIMLHGRGISNLLDRFRQIVVNRLKEKQGTIDTEQLDIDLRNSIRIYLFSRNKDDSLLFNKSAYRLHTILVLPVNYLRELSYFISLYLLNSGIPNTSYVISAELSWRHWNVINSVENLNSEYYFRYMQKRQDVFFRKRGKRFFETIRMYCPYDNPRLGCTLTSLPIFPDMYEESINKLCKQITEFLGGYNEYNHMRDILSQRDLELMKPRMQMLSFLYSILSLADFCRQYLYLEENELYKIMINGDINKIIINFDDSQPFRREVLSLIKDICFDQAIGRTLWMYAEDVISESDELSTSKKTTAITGKFEYIKGPDNAQRIKINHRAENIFYAIGMKAEIEAYNHLRKTEKYRPNYSMVDRTSFWDYLKEMTGSIEEHNIGSVFGLMDSGLIAMNLEAIKEKDCNQFKVQTVLKAGEMATYILPRRFSVFIPAFAKVERYYGGIYKQPQDIISAFIDYLQDYCYQQDNTIDSRDLKLLKSLEELKSYLLMLYEAGQRFRDWNIDLRNNDLRISSKAARDDDYISAREERARKRHYSNVAMMFVEQVTTKNTNS